MQYYLFVVTALALSLSAFSASADEVDGVSNYAYGVFIGTGVYSVTDRDIYVFRVPLAFDLKEADVEVDRKIGLTLLAPVAIGITNFEFLEEYPELDVSDLQTISFVPGLAVPIALDPYSHLEPFVQAGFGIDTRLDARTFVWGTGARLGTTFGEGSRWLVGGEFLWAGNKPDGGDPTTSFTRWGFGAEYKIPTNWQVLGRDVSWHLRAIKWYFSDPATFEKPLQAFDLNDSNELGLSFGLSRPIRIMGYDFTQAGVGYEWADGFEAITFFTKFPF